MGLQKRLLSWMSLTHCCFLGKSRLSISPLMFVIKVYPDDVVQAITSTAAPTLLKSTWNRPKLPSYSDLSTRTLTLMLLAPWGHYFYSPHLRCRRGYLNPNQFTGKAFLALNQMCISFAPWGIQPKSHITLILTF